MNIQTVTEILKTSPYAAIYNMSGTNRDKGLEHIEANKQKITEAIVTKALATMELEDGLTDREIAWYVSSDVANELLADSGIEFPDESLWFKIQ